MLLPGGFILSRPPHILSSNSELRPNLPRPKIWTPAYVQGEDDVSDNSDGEDDEVRPEHDYEHEHQVLWLC